MFGAVPLGSANSGSAIFVTGARCLDLTSVLLECDPSSEFGLANPWRADSVFCWRNWTLSAGVAVAKIRLVQSVVVDSGNLLVRFDGRLTPDVAYELSCSALPFAGVFSAPVSHPSAIQRRSREQIIQDWAKPERPQDLQGGALGSYQALAGDLALTSGAASLYERVTRRAATLAGEMVHDLDYGMDWRVKGRLSLDAVQRYQSRLLAQIKRDPDVVRCSVSVSQVPTNPDTLSVVAQVETADGPLLVSTEVGRS